MKTYILVYKPDGKTVLQDDIQAASVQWVSSAYHFLDDKGAIVFVVNKDLVINIYPKPVTPAA